MTFGRKTRGYTTGQQAIGKKVWREEKAEKRRKETREEAQERERGEKEGKMGDNKQSFNFLISS